MRVFVLLAALATRSWAQHFSPKEKEALEELRQAGLLESDIDELLALEEAPPIDHSTGATVATDDIILYHDSLSAAHTRLALRGP